MGAGFRVMVSDWRARRRVAWMELESSAVAAESRVLVLVRARMELVMAILLVLALWGGGLKLRDGDVVRLGCVV